MMHEKNILFNLFFTSKAKKEKYKLNYSLNLAVFELNTSTNSFIESINPVLD